MVDAEIRLASDHSLLIVLGRGISRDLQWRIVQLCALIENEAVEAVRNIHPAYGSVLITFDPRVASREIMEEAGRRWLRGMGSSGPPSGRQIEIPVCYSSSFGPDLPDVAAHAGLSQEAVVHIHSSVEYFVYFLGFSPGFPYLGELPAALHVPRLTTPRTSVSAGSVAIGGAQTGIYPLASPGGWRIIGRTPLVLFDPLKTRPNLLRMGDFVRFRSISECEFDRAREGQPK